jgi:c-di-GMP-binding flagellar brake protein YcgR
MEPSRFEIFKQASRIATYTPSVEDIFLALVVVTFFFIFFIILPYWAYKEYKKYLKKKVFFKTAFISYNLEPDEAEFLWKLSREFKVDPLLLLSSYASFEKFVYRYIKKYGIKDLDVIQRIRAKLGFTKMPDFVTLATTMDIDVYQPVKVILEEEVYDGAVAENNQNYWAVTFLKKEPRNLKPGDEIVISFIRPNDGRYIIPTKVLDIKRREGHLVAILEHTDRFEKIQLRAYVRWPVNIPCKFAVLPLRYISEEADLDSIISKLNFHKGVIRDISVGGLKLCSEEITSEISKISEGSYLLVDFMLDDTHFENVICEVVRTIKQTFERGMCFGCTFVNLPDEYQQKIQQFIWNEQRKIIKLYKGEL